LFTAIILAKEFVKDHVSQSIISIKGT